MHVNEKFTSSKYAYNDKQYGNVRVVAANKNYLFGGTTIEIQSYNDGKNKKMVLKQ